MSEKDSLYSTIERMLEAQLKKILKSDSSYERFESSGYFEPNSKLGRHRHEYLQRIFKHQLSKSRMDGSTSAADQNHVYTYRTKDDRSSRRI